MLKNISIKSRLIFVIAFLSASLIGGGIIGLTSLHYFNGALKSMYQSRLAPMEQLELIVRNIDRNRMAVAEAITGNPDAIARKVEEIEKRAAEITKSWDSYSAAVKDPEERRLGERFVESRRKFLDEGLKPAVAALRAGKAPQALEIMQGPMAKLYVSTQESIDALIKHFQDTAQSEFESGQKIYDNVFYICLLALSGAVIIGVLIGLWLVHAIFHPLREAVGVAKSVAAGDLTHDIVPESRDETGQLLQALKEMTDNLARTVGTVRHSVETIGVGSKEIATGNADLSARTESQASSLEETASSMEELTTTVKQNAENERHGNRIRLFAGGAGRAPNGNRIF